MNAPCVDVLLTAAFVGVAGIITGKSRTMYFIHTGPNGSNDDVTDGHFVYIYSAIFRHQTDLFYCAQDIGAVVCPFIYHYATHTANGFRAVRHLWNHCAAERTCRFVSRWSGAYFIPIRSMFGPAGCIAHVIYRNEYNPGT